MALRIYIVAADSAKPLEPSFKKIPGGRLNGAVEVLEWPAFVALDRAALCALAAGLARDLGRHDLAAPLLGAGWANGPPAGDDGLPEERG